MNQKKTLTVLIVSAFLVTLVVVFAILFPPSASFGKSGASVAKINSCLQDWNERCTIVFADDEVSKYCLKLETIDSQDDCFNEVANAKAEPAFCGNIVNEEKQAFCKTMVSSFESPRL